MITRLKTQKGNIEVRRDFSKEGMTQVRTISCNSIGVLLEFFTKLGIQFTQKGNHLSNSTRSYNQSLYSIDVISM